MAAAETALDHVRKFCVRAAEDQNAQLDAAGRQEPASAGSSSRPRCSECADGSGGFRLFGGRSKTRQLRHFLDALGQFARQRLAEEVAGAVKHSFAALAGKLTDRARDLGFCRQRLQHLIENLDYNPADETEDLAGTRPGSEHTLTRSPMPTPDAFWEVIRQSATARVVLPDDEEDLERAALRFLQSLKPDHWIQLDKELNERVLMPRGGLQAACVNSGDLIRQLAMPLLAGDELDPGTSTCRSWTWPSFWAPS